MPKTKFAESKRHRKQERGRQLRTYRVQRQERSSFGTHELKWFTVARHTFDDPIQAVRFCQTRWSDSYRVINQSTGTVVCEKSPTKPKGCPSPEEFVVLKLRTGVLQALQKLQNDDPVTFAECGLICASPEEAHEHEIECAKARSRRGVG